MHEPGFAGKPRPQRREIAIAPIALGHFGAVGPGSDDILDPGARDGLAAEKPLAVQDDVMVTQRNQATGEGEQVLLLLAQAPPVKPELISLSWQ